ncbi:unnamed protein product, partial [Owenia fusiformis]
LHQLHGSINTRGTTFKNEIRKTLLELHKDNLQKCLDFYETKAGNVFCEGFLKAGYERFPHIMEELKGMAKATEIPLQMMLINNLEREILAKITPMDESPGCTDVFVNNGTTRAWGHNEDGWPEMKPYTFFVMANIDPYISTNGSSYPREKFAAHCYPGNLPGWDFGFNYHGFAYSMNILMPKEVGVNTVCEVVLMRGMLSCSSVSEARERILQEGYGISCGLSFQFSMVGEDHIYNIECAPNKPRSLISEIVIKAGGEHTPDGFFVRSNNYIHMPGQQTTIPSVFEREKIWKTYSPTSIQDIRTLLGDTQHAEFPIYRTGTKSDIWATVCTAVFDMNKKHLMFFRDNPATTDQLLTIPFDILNMIW